MENESVKIYKAEAASNSLITVSTEAEVHLQQQLQKESGKKVIRIAVKKSGCSGLKYVVEMIESPQETDHLVKTDNLTLYIDSQSIPYLQGLHLYLLKKGLNSSLRFDNPNAESHCGCGESFNIEE